MKPASIIEASFHGRLGSFTLNCAFTIPACGITGLFGPSGSGKTTILRCVAGLTHLPGKLIVKGETWQDDDARLFKRPHRRAIGYVFQEGSLFPHLSVRENLLFGTKRATSSGANVYFKLDDVVDLLGLQPLIERAAPELSGGERQRVSIGRALMSQPDLLLLDEPLSALDHESKEEILPYLESLHDVLSVPSLYVSHDMNELKRLADMIVLLDKGCVVANGPLTNLQVDPTAPLMNAPNASTMLTGRVTKVDKAYGLVHIDVGDTILIVASQSALLGDTHHLRVDASDVSFTRVRPLETSILNCLPVRLISMSDQAGDQAHINIVAALGEDGKGAQIVGRVTRKSRETLGLKSNDRVYAQIKSVSLNKGWRHDDLKSRTQY